MNYVFIFKHLKKQLLIHIWFKLIDTFLHIDTFGFANNAAISFVQSAKFVLEVVKVLFG